MANQHVTVEDCYYTVCTHLCGANLQVKGGRILSCNATFFRYCDMKQPIKILIKDSLEIINIPLRKFGECFKLDVEKDIMPYPIYNPLNIDRVYVPITSALHYIKDKKNSSF